MSTIGLQVAGPADADHMAALLEHYVAELGPRFGVTADADGRFRYAKLPLYWREPERRFAFFICDDDARVGAALVTHEPASADAPEHFDVAEFFVLSAHRAKGIGRQAAWMLWDRLPGPWAVRVSQANIEALPFWRNAVERYTDGAFSVGERPGERHNWHVFTFRSRLAAAG